MSAPAIETSGLVKIFGDNRAVDGVDLTVPARHRLRPARTQRRRQDHGGTDAGHPAETRRRQRPGLRPRRRRQADAVRSRVSLTGSVRVGRRGPDRHRKSGPAGPAARLPQAAGPRAGRPAARGVRADRRGRPSGEEVLRRHAPAHRHRRQHPQHSRPAVPGRADDRARPAQPQPGLGHHPGRRGQRHHGPAHHAIPGRGRPARRPDRGDRPRQGDRRGHAGPAEVVDRCGHRPRATARRRAAAGGGTHPGLGELRDRRCSMDADPVALTARADGRLRAAAPPSRRPGRWPRWPAPGSSWTTSRSVSPASTRCSWR